MTQAIKVTGVKELASAFKQVDSRLPGELRQSFRGIAELVVRRAVGRGAPSGALLPRATASGASIGMPEGGPASAHDTFGYYPWLDFGGGKPHARGVTASHGAGDRRALIKGGRYVYPAIAESGDDIKKATLTAVSTVAREAGFAVSDG